MLTLRLEPVIALVVLRQVELLAACKRRGLPVLCCAGAGAKADPTRLAITDISEATVDPLARSVRPRTYRSDPIVMLIMARIGYAVVNRV